MRRITSQLLSVRQMQNSSTSIAPCSSSTNKPRGAATNASMRTPCSCSAGLWAGVLSTMSMWTVPSADCRGRASTPGGREKSTSVPPRTRVPTTRPLSGSTASEKLASYACSTRPAAMSFATAETICSCSDGRAKSARLGLFSQSRSRTRGLKRSGSISHLPVGVGWRWAEDVGAQVVARDPGGCLNLDYEFGRNRVPAVDPGPNMALLHGTRVRRKDSSQGTLSAGCYYCSL